MYPATIGHRYGSPRVRHYTATTRSYCRGRPLGVTRSRITVRRQPGASIAIRACRPAWSLPPPRAHRAPRLTARAIQQHHPLQLSGRTVGISRSHITFRRRFRPRPWRTHATACQDRNFYAQRYCNFIIDGDRIKLCVFFTLLAGMTLACLSA